MAIAVTIEATVSRSPAEVFAQIADIERWPSWLIASGIIRVERSSGGPLVEGEHLTVEQRAAGRAGTFEAQVTALQSPSRLALHGREDPVGPHPAQQPQARDAGAGPDLDDRAGLHDRRQEAQRRARTGADRDDAYLAGTRPGTGDRLVLADELLGVGPARWLEAGGNSGWQSGGDGGPLGSRSDSPGLYRPAPPSNGRAGDSSPE